MDLAGAKREIEAAIKDEPVTLQINRAASQLTIVINRQQGGLSEKFDYKVLAEKIMVVLHVVDLDEIRTIKFYGRETGGQTDWQWVNSVTSASPSTTTQKAVNKTQVQVNEEQQTLNTAKTKNFVKSTESSRLGWVLFTVGCIMMWNGFVYDPTVPSEDGFRHTYNIGEINIKSTYTNTGGFLAICGAIFATCSRGQKDNSAEERGDKA